YWCAFAFLLVIFAIDLVFIVVYEMTGSTFDYSMLKLRGDAMAIVESIPINFVFFSVAGIAISLYMILARYFIGKVPAPRKLLPRGVTAGVMAAVLVFHGGFVYASNYKYNPSDLSYKLYSGSTASYNDRGIVGNFVEEMYKGAFFSKVDLGDRTELKNYIYASVNEPTEFFGAAKDYNVITVLAESCEWFSFMRDLADAGLSDAYPGGYGKYFARMGLHDAAEQEQFLRALFPHLYELYDTSVACLNNHAREKTDISENQSIIGNYPTDCYINYDYPQNTVPYSLPNMLRTLYGVESNSFHNGEYNFYNRTVHHENALGFAKFTASEEMEEEHPDIFTDYKAAQLEHNLDNQMMRAYKEEMFPADRRFNTYITSISMHGKYAYRQNLKHNYKTLFNCGLGDAFFEADELAVLQKLNAKYDGDIWGADLAAKDEETLKNTLDSADIFFHYIACTLEFDASLGTMVSYLQNTVSEVTGKPLMDNTLIVLFGDHNVYYQSLGEQVKNLYLTEKNGRNYTDLFRVPLLVHIGNTGMCDRIYKFTTTTDIVPTVLDLLGVRYYNNLNYGRSIFTADESIIYSRAYNLFITDKLYFSSLNNIKYRSADADNAYIDTVKEKALTLLDKTSHVNRIFYYDFLSGENGREYNEKLLALNA
ncbi:MAG: sulfatase-like hydrolase/transferase, partial [Clostridiales bacterium]|nr:sulfatase-like hydrolase/transferase [Clostridiales bacterium]